jgi:hypothetical protein
MKKILLFFAVALSIGFLFSCNNNKSSNGGESTVTPPVTDTSNHVMAAQANSFCTLKLDSADLVVLLTDKDTKKLLLQFTDDGISTCVGLTAYGAKKDNVVTAAPKALTALANPSTSFNGSVILGNQELTLKGIKTILGLPHSSGKIDPTKLKSLQFVPLRDGNNHIYYAVTKLGMSEADGSALTNPSPPAPPCENGCDY